MRKLFVSYARENKPDVDQLVEHLRTMGYDTWVDTALRGGQDWWDEILDRIADTDVVIAIYSSAALNSTACGREFEWATALGKPVIPVAVEPPPTALPSRFARRQIIDYSQPAQRDRAALQLQGALAAIPPAPPMPDPLPDPPKAPLSYLTDIIDLITQPGVLDHDQQHQILIRIEPALTSVDPLERRGGVDILERFSARPDLYADVDRAITRLRQLPHQPVPVDSEPSAQNTASTAEQSDVQVDAGGPTAAITAPPVWSPASTPQAESTHRDGAALASEDVAADLAANSAPGADANARETTDNTPIAHSDTQAGAHLADEPARVSEPFAPSDLKQPLLRRLSRRTKIIIGAAAAALVIVIVAVTAIVVGGQPSDALSKFALPFTGLDGPEGVAVDAAGAVYVTDDNNNRVLKLTAGSSTQTALPFTGLNQPRGVAVDGAGSVYVTDYKNNRVLKLAAGATAPIELPFTGLSYPIGVAVDTGGNAYVTGTANGADGVLKLAAGATSSTALPFTGLEYPFGVAVDAAQNVYIADNDHKRVLKLAAGATASIDLLFTGLAYPHGVAVDAAENVYVTDDSGHVLKLAVGATAPTVLSVNSLSSLAGGGGGVAVDSSANVYVVAYNRVLKLPNQ